jgi:Tfp pilus assembly protein PilN
MKRINLLPHEERVKAGRERGALYALIGLVVLVAILGIVYVWQNNQVSSKNNQLAGLNSQMDTLNAQVARLTPYQTLATQRTTMLQTAEALYNSRVTWSNILQELSLVIPNDVRLQSLSATVPSTMLPGAAQAAAGQSAAPATALTFSGVAASQQSVATFMTRLGLLPQLMNINLSSSSQTAASTSGQASYATFTITASLRPFLTPPPTTTLAGAQ